MKKKTMSLNLLLCLSLASCLLCVSGCSATLNKGMTAVDEGASKTPFKSTVHREPIEWCNVWLTNTNKIDLPRVLLVGDSITQQYYNGVRQELAGKAYCGRLTTSACVADPLFETQLRSVIEHYEFDVIHFNNGLHGEDYLEEEYQMGYEKALMLIREKQPAAKIVIALSTPTKSGGPKAFLIPRIEARNKIVSELAKNIKAQVNDLFTPMQGHPEYYCDDYHYKSEAIAVQAGLVAKVIRETLGE